MVSIFQPQADSTPSVSFCVRLWLKRFSVWLIETKTYWPQTHTDSHGQQSLNLWPSARKDLKKSLVIWSVVSIFQPQAALNLSVSFRVRLWQKRNKMEFSFIILTWNSERYIDACINSVVDEIRSLRESGEIYIVDNGSIDSTPDRIRTFVRLYPDMIHPIFLSTNQGTTRSRNMALRSALCRYVVILDSDIVLLPGILAGLRKSLQEDANLGLAVPRLIYPNGHHQKSVDMFPSLFHKFKRFLWLKRMERNEAARQPMMQPIKVDYAISAVWMLPRSTIARVGLLDENFFYSPEDVDYCLRIWMAGLSILYNPFVTAIHHTQEISRGFKPNAAFISHVIGLFYYFRKHKYIFKPPVFTQSADITRLNHSNTHIPSKPLF